MPRKKAVKKETSESYVGTYPKVRVDTKLAEARKREPKKVAPAFSKTFTGNGVVIVDYKVDGKPVSKAVTFNKDTNWICVVTDEAMAAKLSEMGYKEA